MTEQDRAPMAALAVVEAERTLRRHVEESDEGELARRIKDLLAFEGDDRDLKLYASICARTGLDPFARQVYAVFRRERGSDKKRMSLQTSIDGFRLIAVRSGKYEGQVGPHWCGPDGKWREVWLDAEVDPRSGMPRPLPPMAARVGVWRTGFREPVWGVVTWAEFVQTETVYENGQQTPRRRVAGLWASHGPTMLAKTAEGQALRKAFPAELSGIYTDDEMAQADNDLGVARGGVRKATGAPVGGAPSATTAAGPQGASREATRGSSDSRGPTTTQAAGDGDVEEQRRRYALLVDDLRRQGKRAPKEDLSRLGAGQIASRVKSLEAACGTTWQALDAPAQGEGAVEAPPKEGEFAEVPADDDAEGAEDEDDEAEDEDEAVRVRAGDPEPLTDVPF
jgi:phage recombination protein Bet